MPLRSRDVTSEQCRSIAASARNRNFTAEPDDDGNMRFFSDVYKRDKAAVVPDDEQPCGV